MPVVISAPDALNDVNVPAAGDEPPTTPSNEPSILAEIVDFKIVKSPVLDPVSVVKPKANLPSDSSQPINALLPVVPLSIIIPASFVAAPVRPLLNSINESDIVVLVLLIVVVVPVTVKFPVIVAFGMVNKSDAELNVYPAFADNTPFAPVYTTCPAVKPSAVSV